MKLDGKVALVTGAAGGIGQAIARRLAHEGAHVALADIRTKPLDGITRTIESYDRKALTVAVDVTQSDQVTQMVQAVVEAFGRIDIFFNNAGIIGSRIFWMSPKPNGTTLSMSTSRAYFCVARL